MTSKEFYEYCFNIIIGAEGGFQKDPRDRGNWTTGVIGQGELKGTKYGITAMNYGHLDIENLTLNDAREIYKMDYWDAICGDRLPRSLALMLFDEAVNQGINAATRDLQSALEVSVDGVFGNKTLAAAQTQDPGTVLEAIVVARFLRYTNTGTFDVYKKGWTKRLVHITFLSIDLLEEPMPVIEEPKVTDSTFIEPSPKEPVKEKKNGVSNFWTHLGFRW